MMRSLVLLLLGGILGALLFHLYYLRLDAAGRCGWDHPLDRDARETCRQDASDPVRGYTKKARHELDDLIGKVAH